VWEDLEQVGRCDVGGGNIVVEVFEGAERERAKEGKMTLRL
jgi:hypothetical protein